MLAYSTVARKFLALTFPPFSTGTRLRHLILIVSTITTGLAVAWLPVKTAILLVGGTIFLTLVLIQPILSLYVLIPIIPFSSLLAVSLGGFKAGVMEVVLVLGVTAGVLKILVSRTPPNQPIKLRRAPLLWPFLILLGAVALSWLNALSIGASLIETAKWVEMLALYLVIVALLPTRHIKWVIVVLMLTGMVQAILGLYQFIFKVGPEGFLLFGGRFLRAYGTFAQPNPYAGYLGLLLPLALSLVIWGFEESFRAIRASLRSSSGGTSHQSRDRSDHSIFRIIPILLKLSLLSLPFVLMSAALFASQSRGAWLGFAAASVVTLVVRSKKAAIILTTLAIVMAIVALIGAFDLDLTESGATGASKVYTAVTQRFVNAISIISLNDIANIQVTNANFATVERLAHWQAARDMWRDNPWLGVGFGNYAIIYPVYAVGRWLDPLGHAHNYLLNIGAETGLAGITTYLIFWIFTFGLLWLAVKRSDGFHKAVAAGVVGIMVHLHVHNFVDNLYVQGMYLHIAIMLGLASVIYEHYKSPE